MKKKVIAIVMLSLALSISACKDETKNETTKVEPAPTAPEAANGVDLSSDKAKLSYAVGFQFGNTLKEGGIIDDIDPEIVAKSLLDAVAGNSSMNEEEVIAALTSFQTRKNEEAIANAEKAAAEGVAFLEANKGKEGVVTTDSGLQYTVITEGEGAAPTEESEVEVHYKGSLVDGTVFDSSYDRGQPASFPIGGVIPGFREGMLLMKEGSKHTLYIPAELAYGKQAPPSIGPDQMLIFEVELLKVK